MIKHIFIFHLSNKFINFLFPGSHFIRFRPPNGRKASRTVFAIQSLRGVRGVTLESDQQEWENGFGKFQLKFNEPIKH